MPWGTAKPSLLLPDEAPMGQVGTKVLTTDCCHCVELPAGKLLEFVAAVSALIPASFFAPSHLQQRHDLDAPHPDLLLLLGRQCAEAFLQMGGPD